MSHHEISMAKSWRTVSTCFVLIIAVSLGVFFFNFAQASENTAAQNSISTKESSSHAGCEDVPEFGGPTSVGTQLKEDDAPKQPLYRFDQLQQLLSPYYGP